MFGLLLTGVSIAVRGGDIALVDGPQVALLADARLAGGFLLLSIR